MQVTRNRAYVIAPEGFLSAHFASRNVFKAI